MRALVQTRDPSTAAVPLSGAVPHYVDAVGLGNRVARFVHIKARARCSQCAARSSGQILPS
eukprot:9892308-Alexandrium_andersonii.AAC.1